MDSFEEKYYGDEAKVPKWWFDYFDWLSAVANMPMWSVEVLWMLAVSTNHSHAIQMQHTSTHPSCAVFWWMFKSRCTCFNCMFHGCLFQWFFMHFPRLMGPCDLSTVSFHEEYWEKNWTNVTATYWHTTSIHFGRKSAGFLAIGQGSDHIGETRSACFTLDATTAMLESPNSGVNPDCQWDGWAFGPRTDA